MDLDKEDISKKTFEPNSGVLYVIGTPIGNLGDLSPRAKHLLSNVSVIACEDTRHSGQLLKKFKIKGKLVSFHKHNTKLRIPKLIKELDAGESLGLISDAGLPGISDPGEELVLATRQAGHDVICIPGPCAAITALVSSGLPSQRFCFEGFLPYKQKDRSLILQSIAKEKRTTIIYESPHRLLKLLKELYDLCGTNRPLQVARELTKKYEEQIGPTLGNALEHFTNNQPKGEFTLVLGGKPNSEELKKKNNVELQEEMKRLLDKGLSLKNASRELAKKTGYSKNFLYSLIPQKIKKNDDSQTRTAK
ncbi:MULTISPECIES: 16S rRNA (cytidine(1402)-2'-O)-methyltransferase [Prochlorococcus]|uniref:Ribosomal RNA small subunit methyltransferase I n=2 Tax=Prochlorococcus TaxID=1218 RepID=Q7VAZ4_PROMA|nr:Tetrapyrrole methylase family protein [Prochlorococcus marinus subsp. marinus str. CCMP1375]KGG14233.1 rRNA small subunit methyltransferase I [Prochlorococcus marinus str. LG]KGG22195.1 rRNA small subunit methyltransferase I [Prochlorococcus marinus str. SS2]KGG37298.1 rRNA small subunit methyltransferase I [Prochlorococcus sp. SS52]